MANIGIKTFKSMACMFDTLYKMGVEDAAGRDMAEVSEYLERVREPGKFKMLRNEASYDWAVWRSFLMSLSWGLSTNKSFMVDFLREATKLNSVAGCFYTVSLDFYIKGVVDGATHPVSGLVMSKFMATPGVLLPDFDKKGDKGKVGLRGYVSLAQGFAYSHIERELGLKETSKKIRKSNYMKFLEVVWAVVAAESSRIKASLAERKRAAKRLEAAKASLLPAHGIDIFDKRGNGQI